jgi:transposase
VATPGKNVRLAVCGACRWPDGPFLFHHGLRSVDTACFLGLVVRLARRARATKKPIVLVLDNASAHTSARSTRVLKELRALVQPFWLPLYSSELLNEIEPVWGHLKEDYFSQMLVRSPRQFVDEAVAFLTTLSKPGALRNTLKPRKRKSMGKKFRRVA